jgi:hypothetical protein
MTAAEGPIEIDGATLVVLLGSRATMGFVAENNAPRVRDFEPALEPHRLRFKDVRPAEQIPKCRLTFMNEKVVNPCVYSLKRVGIVRLCEGRIRIVAAMLNERFIRESYDRGTFPQPLLEMGVASQLVEVVALATKTHPPTDSRWIAQRPEHGDLMVAQDHCRVRAIARVPKGADAEHAVVDEVAEKNRVPFGRRVGLQRLEEPLEVAVHVAHDQDGQICHERDASGGVG